MQCIHDTVYTLEHPCYATLSLSQFLQYKKKKRKTKKKRIYRFDREYRISDSDCTAKNTQYKRKKALFFICH